MSKQMMALVLAAAGACVGGCGTGDDGIRGETAVSVNASYKLVRKGSNKCLDVKGGGSADGTVLQQSACTNGANQVFRVDDLGGGKVKLVNPATGKCVDVNGNGNSNGTKMQLWTCNGTGAQSFQLQDQGSGVSRIKNTSSGKCADISGGSNNDGVALQLWSCNSGDAQRWTFTPITGGGGGTGGSGGGGGSGGMGGTGGSGGSGDGLVWKKANLTNFESYPAPDSDECREFNGCTWEGQFAFVDGKQTEDWVRMHNIVAVHSKDGGKYALKKLRLKQGSHQIDVTVYDECSDSDCNGCCTQNSKSTGFLIDIEKYTMQRFGSGDGIVDWACLDPGCK
jgi:hypothetical protein